MVAAFIRERGVTVCPPRTADWSHKASVNGHETPDSFLFRESVTSKSPEQRLAEAKILVMIRDLAGSPYSNPCERTKLRQAAQGWFFGRSDFEAWCETAGLDPAFIRQKAKNIEQNGWPQWRAEAGKGKRYAERAEYRARAKLRGLQ